MSTNEETNGRTASPTRPPRDVVRDGAKALDKAAPGWASRIDLTTVELSATNRCILGQVFGSYPAGVAALGFTYSSQAIDHGFMATRWSHAELGREWAREVAAR